MENKKLYCHTDLVMTTGGICAFAGKSYEVIDESDYYYEIINADGEPHTFSKKTSGSNYRTWFSLEPVNLNKMTVAELLSKIQFLEEGLKTTKGTLVVAVTSGSSDTIVNKILHDYRKLEMAHNKILEQEITLHE